MNLTLAKTRHILMAFSLLVALSSCARQSEHARWQKVGVNPQNCLSGTQVANDVPQTTAPSQRLTAQLQCFAEKIEDALAKADTSGDLAQPSRPGQQEASSVDTFIENLQAVLSRDAGILSALPKGNG